MRQKTIVTAFIIMFLSVSLFAVHEFSKSGSLVLLADQHWETYGVGGTCISGGHNLFVADIDGDGFMEIVTGGFMYSVIDGSAVDREAPFKIWNWNGQEVSLEKSHKWPGGIRCVYLADVDGDGVDDILTAGTVINGSGTYGSLRVWSWENKELRLKGEYEGVSVGSIFVSDLNGDGKAEIITVGSLSGDLEYTAQLCLWHLEQNGLVLRQEFKLAGVTRAASVYAADLNGDGNFEIITAGYAEGLEDSSGQVCVWCWSGEELVLMASEEWQLVEGVYALTTAGGVQGNTMVRNVKVADVDGDGRLEIFTGGFTFDGESVLAQFRVWAWDGNALLLLGSEEWANDYLNEVMCISVGDVDGDSGLDVVTSGMVAAYGSFKDEGSVPDRGQLRVWGWAGEALTLKYSRDWTGGDGVSAWHVATGDLDNDGNVEIVTVGCLGIGALCDPDMRIWSIVASLPTGLIIVAVVSIVVSALAVTYLLVKRHFRRLPK